MSLNIKEALEAFPDAKNGTLFMDKIKPQNIEELIKMVKK